MKNPKSPLYGVIYFMKITKTPLGPDNWVINKEPECNADLDALINELTRNGTIDESKIDWMIQPLRKLYGSFKENRAPSLVNESICS